MSINDNNNADFLVHDHDVLSGRGVNIADHPGNQQFRALVASRANKSYCTSFSTMKKRVVAMEIIKIIKSLDPPGKFLKRESLNHVGRRTGPWMELKEEDVVKKTCRALHDCSRLDRQGYATRLGEKLIARNQESIIKARQTIPNDEQDPGSPTEIVPCGKRKQVDEVNAPEPELSSLKKERIIIHKSTRYKKHSANIAYLECCKHVATFYKDNADNTVLAQRVVSSMKKKGLSFWIDEDRKSPRRMANEEVMKTVKKKLANDKFSASIKRKTTIVKAELINDEGKKEAIGTPMGSPTPNNESMKEREVAALDAMISLSNSHRSEKTTVHANDARPNMHGPPSHLYRYPLPKILTHAEKHKRGTSLVFTPSNETNMQPPAPRKQLPSTYVPKSKYRMATATSIGPRDNCYARPRLDPRAAERAKFLAFVAANNETKNPAEVAQKHLPLSAYVPNYEHSRIMPANLRALDHHMRPREESRVVDRTASLISLSASSQISYSPGPPPSVLTTHDSMVCNNDPCTKTQATYAPSPVAPYMLGKKKHSQKSKKPSKSHFKRYVPYSRIDRFSRS